MMHRTQFLRSDSAVATTRWPSSALPGRWRPRPGCLPEDRAASRAAARDRQEYPGSDDRGPPAGGGADVSTGARMFYGTSLRRELQHRLRQAIMIALGLAVGIGLAVTVTAASAGVRQAQ